MANSSGARKLSPLRRNLRLCVVDGVAAMPVTLLGQPGNIVLAALLTSQFQLSAGVYGLIVSLPFWFNFLQVLLQPSLARRMDARRLCIASAWLHTIGWLLLTITLPFLPVGDKLPTILTFVAGFSIISLASALIGVSWNAWMQEVVPPRLRGKYFGVRNRLLYISMITFLLIVSALLEFMHGSMTAYMILLGFAIVLRFFSVRAEMKMTAAPRAAAADAALPWREQIKHVRAHPALLGFIGFTALLGFILNLFGPFYPVFMYEPLQLSVAAANLILILSPLGAAVSFPAWGRLLDKYGNIPVMAVALGLWQSCNLIWCVVTPDRQWLLYVVVTTGGLFSAGYGIGAFNLLLKLTPSAARTMGMAIFVSVSSLAAAFGPPIGGHLIAWAKASGFDPLAIYHMAFLVAPVCSLLSIFLLLRIREPKAASVAEVVGAMRNVRTIASLLGMSFLVNRVFYRTRRMQPDAS